MFNWLKSFIMGWRAKREQRSREALDYPWTSHNRADVPMLAAPAKIKTDDISERRTTTVTPVQSSEVPQKPREDAVAVEGKTLEVVAEVKVVEKNEGATTGKPKKKPTASRKRTGTPNKKNRVGKSIASASDNADSVKDVTASQVFEAQGDEDQKKPDSSSVKKTIVKRKSIRTAVRTRKGKPLTPYEYMQTTTIKHIRETLAEQYPEVSKIARKTAMVAYLSSNEQAFKALIEASK